MIIRKLTMLLFAAGFTLMAGTTNAAIVFDDTFDVGAPPSRNDDAADPLDRQWYKNHSTALSVVDDTGGIGSGNALNSDNTNVGFGSFGKFAANFPTVSLNNVGDRAVLSFDVRRLTSGTPSGSGPSFRFGLYDNDDSPLTSDSSNNILSNTADDIGYRLNLNVGSPGAFATREGPESSGILGGPVGANEVGLANALGNPFAGLNDSGPHDVVTTLLRTGGGVRILVDVDGTTVIDATDDGIDPDTNMPAGLFVTDFDVVGFGIGSSNVAYDFRVDNIGLEFTPVPETGSLALVAVAGAAAVAARALGTIQSRRVRAAASPARSSRLSALKR